MRPNWTGWAIILFFIAVGMVLWITIPDAELLGQGFVAVAVLLAIVYAFMMRRAQVVQEMISGGVRGTAQIIEATQTGTYVNNQPRVKLKLRIEAPGVPPFEDTRTDTIPMISMGLLTSTAPLAVYLDPAKPKNYVIDWGNVGAASAPMPDGMNSNANVTISSRSFTADADMAQSIMAALTQAGIDPTKGGTYDLNNFPQARDAVINALQTHGLDFAHDIAAASPAIPIQPSAQPVERMQKLDQLKNAGLISDEEYQATRKQILDGM